MALQAEACPSSFSISVRIAASCVAKWVIQQAMQSTRRSVECITGLRSMQASSQSLDAGCRFCAHLVEIARIVNRGGSWRKCVYSACGNNDGLSREVRACGFEAPQIVCRTCGTRVLCDGPVPGLPAWAMSEDRPSGPRSHGSEKARGSCTMRRDELEGNGDRKLKPDSLQWSYVRANARCDEAAHTLHKEVSFSAACLAAQVRFPRLAMLPKEENVPQGLKAIEGSGLSGTAERPCQTQRDRAVFFEAGVFGRL